MQVFLPQEIGFCFGVKRALKLVLNEIKRNGKIYTLGDLIHNSQVVEDLERKGIESIENLSQIKEGTLVIRSHGVDLSLIEEAKKRKIRVLNATCPHVVEVQNIVKSLSQKSYLVVIVGSNTHPEVKGLMASVKNGKVYVVKNEGEAEKLPSVRKMGIVAQTTESLDNFSNIVKNLIRKGKECRAFNTICRIIRERQEGILKLAEKTQAVIVIGGYNSSNTRQLAKLCRSSGAKTYFIEKEEDLDIEELKGIKRIALTGGTSTPRETIEKIKNKLSLIN
ncbi:4-hydroxy-3-methylbut-2-enyl diphosphate reductase [Candidatus Aerophobetes bacterium]|uniref:4-hydroxy-3-methylbut-2-enyl diphosphate reductase n=1 Tax=Aerophobetes bacterium TaxID=2030807 RepID=A0A523ZJW8_UNCAE|nr:MAG: 4-hydroxy-3-methylbut-2-enyl diphosphate reductase [Candidatus Aerophobetes bacterium]